MASRKNRKRHGKASVGSGQSRSVPGSSVASTAALRFTLTNLWFGLAGLATVTLGYVFLSQGSITAAPLLLVLGYLVLLPLAIIK